jgi:CheY-like chemotaxis protein
MTVDGGIRLLDAITKLCAALVWPAVALFVLVRFGPGLRDFLASLGELTVKAGGIEASARRKQEAAAALTAAVVSHPDNTDATPHQTAKEALAAFDVVQEAATPRAIRRAQSATVLWVDDRPNNNIFERQALEALGVSFVLALSTDEALERIERQHFDAIISDMGRPPDPKAGYTLLDKIRSMGNKTPFIIYAGSRAPEHRAEAKRRGALDCTNRPDELFGLVLSAIDRRT